LLLEFSTAAAKALSPAEILRLFCRTTRTYFGVSGAYIWHFFPPDQLVAEEADGWMADQFRNVRLKTNQSAIVVETIQKRKPILVNSVDTERYPMAREFQIRSLLAVPLLMFDGAIGATVFVHTTDAEFFNQDHLNKASILAAQLGSLLEAARLTHQAKEEKRRAAILAEVAQSFSAEPDFRLLVDSIADRVRALLRTPLVCVLGREASGFELWSVATEDPVFAVSVRARQDRKGLHFASDLASRALQAGEPITVAVNPASHLLGDLVPAGTLLVAPFRTSSKEGAILVYPRREGAFTPDEKKLLPVVTSFAAVAISNAELYAKARTQADELHQMVSIASDLGSISDLEQFMDRFIKSGSLFIGF
jgi:GAF domain-containing protein